MKRFYIVVLSLAICVSLSACAFNKKITEENGISSAEMGSINHGVVDPNRQDSSNPNNNGVYCTYGWNPNWRNVFVNAKYIYGLIWINA